MLKILGNGELNDNIISNLTDIANKYGYFEIQIILLHIPILVNKQILKIRLYSDFISLIKDILYKIYEEDGNYRGYEWNTKHINDFIKKNPDFDEYPIDKLTSKYNRSLRQYGKDLKELKNRYLLELNEMKNNPELSIYY